MPPQAREPADYVTCKHCHKDFRAITVRHLRNIHGYEGDHPINDYKHKFRLQSAMCLEVRQKITETKVDFWARQGRHWTDAKVIAAIRRLHREGRSLRGHHVPTRLCLAAGRYFGSWRAAVEKAGFDYEKVTGVRHWSPQKVIEAIQELAQRGVPLSATYVERHHAFLHTAAIKQFPRSWAKALRAAGLDPDEHKKRRGTWDRPRAESWVRRRHARGWSILARDAPTDLVHFVYRRLKTTWPEFVESLNIVYPGIKKRRDWTKQKLLAEIRRRHAEGRPLSYKAVQREHQALIHQARKFYGSWDRAVAAARV
jgi:hypothetical protein